MTRAFDSKDQPRVDEIEAELEGMGLMLHDDLSALVGEPPVIWDVAEDDHLMEPSNRVIALVTEWIELTDYNGKRTR